MQFSIIIPVYNAGKTLADLLTSLKNQTFSGLFEIILIDDCSTDDSVSIVKQFDVTIIESPKNQGPAVCRNVGAQRATGEILVFTDSDCRVDASWLDTIRKRFEKGETEAVMGRLVLPSSTYLGDSISALGFPAGGLVGYEKIWPVDQNGYTESLSTCNCAMSREVFHEAGGFDETFPYPGGEDTLLAYSLRKSGHRIQYCPEIIVHHAPRTSFMGFLRWQYRRGVSSYLFSTKVTQRRDFVKLRIWSIKNILHMYKTDKKIPLIMILLFTGYCSQILGYMLTKINPPALKV
ncbi:MAG: glycosyltransferase [Proteobacteria bacterium]|nr:glycosyltransferase [Pseudomonadota bacterium]MBU1709830.1 glycosyltransferase [Pseudomonadota bacterium]